MAGCWTGGDCGNGCGGLLDESVGDLLLLVPGALDVTVRKALRQALRRFCMDSEIWRFVFEPLPVLKGERVYRLMEQIGSKVVRVVSLETLEGRRITQRKDVRGGAGQYWYESEPGLVVLNQVPERDALWQANVVLRPDADAESMPPELYARWRDVVEAGALHKLLLMPGQPWVQVELAGYHATVYAAGVEQAKAVHLRDLLPGREPFKPVNHFW